MSLEVRQQQIGEQGGTNSLQVSLEKSFALKKKERKKSFFAVQGFMTSEELWVRSSVGAVGGLAGGRGAQRIWGAARKRQILKVNGFK